MVGQLDDAVGVALCLYLLLQSNEVSFRPFYLLFSEMEESYGLRRHPELLRNQGAGLYPQIGAERIACHLLDNDMVPDVVITVESAPELRLDRAVARGLDRESARARLEAQASREERIAVADHVLSNEGTMAELGEQVARVTMKLRERSNRK